MSAPSSAPVAATAPLAPGNAAGINAAQNYTPDRTAIIVGGAIIVGAGIALLASGGGDHHSTSTSTTGTSSPR